MPVTIHGKKGDTVVDTDEFNAAVEAPLSEHHRVIRASSKPIRADQKVRSRS